MMKQSGDLHMLCLSMNQKTEYIAHEQGKHAIDAPHVFTNEIQLNGAKDMMVP